MATSEQYKQLRDLKWVFGNRITDDIRELNDRVETDVNAKIQNELDHRKYATYREGYDQTQFCEVWVEYVERCQSYNKRPPPEKAYYEVPMRSSSYAYYGDYEYGGDLPKGKTESVKTLKEIESNSEFSTGTMSYYLYRRRVLKKID